MLDGVIVRDGPYGIAKLGEVDIVGRDVIVVQTKANRLGMYLLGQALFSKELLKPFNPKSIESVAICTKGDSILEPLAEKYGIRVVVYDTRE